METPYPIPPECCEWRRFRALYLKRRGWYQRDIAETLDISEVSVSRWLADARDYGPESLRARPSPGAPPRLSPAQRRLIPEFLWHGPEAYGFRGQVWTRARVAKVIEWEFGVRSAFKRPSSIVGRAKGPAHDRYCAYYFASTRSLARKRARRYFSLMKSAFPLELRARGSGR